MNNEDLRKLKAAALAATPQWMRNKAFGQLNVQDDKYMLGDSDALYAEISSPISILALIAEAEQARAENGDRQALEKVAEALQQFKRDWMAVPVFSDRVNKSTRDAISRAIGPLVNLDAVGGPLDLSKHK